MNDKVLVDTGPLVAFFSADDQHHSLCAETLKTLRTPLLTSWPVLVETAYFLHRDPASQRLLFSAVAARFLEILPLEPAEFLAIADLAQKYHDLTPQLADLSLVYLAAREKLSVIFTLDRRDFTVFRQTSGAAFTLLPTGELA